MLLSTEKERERALPLASSLSETGVTAATTSAAAAAAVVNQMKAAAAPASGMQRLRETGTASCASQTQSSASSLAAAAELNCSLSFSIRPSVPDEQNASSKRQERQGKIKSETQEETKGCLSLSLSCRQGVLAVDVSLSRSTDLSAASPRVLTPRHVL